MHEAGAWREPQRQLLWQWQQRRDVFQTPHAFWILSACPAEHKRPGLPARNEGNLTDKTGRAGGETVWKLPALSSFLPISPAQHEANQSRALLLSSPLGLVSPAGSPRRGSHTSSEQPWSVPHPISGSRACDGYRGTGELCLFMLSGVAIRRLSCSCWAVGMLLARFGGSTGYRTGGCPFDLLSLSDAGGCCGVNCVRATRMGHESSCFVAVESSVEDHACAIPFQVPDLLGIC
jgi:hypothetical protein